MESTLSIQALKPSLDELKTRYAGDQEQYNLEVARLYKAAGINPLAGCLPTLATIPVFIGLYRCVCFACVRAEGWLDTLVACVLTPACLLLTPASHHHRHPRALTKAADDGLLTAGFFWIPSLGGPTDMAARQAVRAASFTGASASARAQLAAHTHSSTMPALRRLHLVHTPQGSGLAWLFPFVDGAPPIGWHDAVSYLILPVLLIISQWASQKLVTPPNNDPAQQQTQAILGFLPLMIGESPWCFVRRVLRGRESVLRKREAPCSAVTADGVRSHLQDALC
jgi:YidC/Oxa1 family membrane protein insertase